MSFTTLFFDLDDTLYDSGNGLWTAIRERMSDYMFERLGLPRDQIPALRRSYYENYGTTLRGLQLHYKVDADEYLAYVHDLPLARFIQPDPELRRLVSGLPQRKWVFTNADANHAQRVLAILGLQDCFAGIVDVRAMAFHCKPEPEAYQLAIAQAGEIEPGRCVFLDDSPRNLAPARRLGFFTILVGTDQENPAADRTVASLKELPRVAPELWNGEAT